mmetsp:Transcript_114637/g.370430  ORF Transcript_114637/g.370430 Transcript_114637/m.370430 type:complete len:201 (+) Transcript_114637:551-1153(+)
MNISGWQYRVSLILSSGPLRAISLGSQPRTSVALASISLTPGLSTTSFSMPTYCEPWPGKSSAAGTGGFFFSTFWTLATGRSNGRLRISSGMVAYGTSNSPMLNQYLRSFFMSLSSLSVTIGSSPGERFFTSRYSCDLMLFFSVSSPFMAWKSHSCSTLCNRAVRQIWSSGVKPPMSGAVVSTPFSTIHCKAQGQPNCTA